MKKLDLTKGSIFKGLLVFSLPIFFVYLLNSFYNAVDIFILSMSGADELISAVASAFTPINLCMTLLTGAGVAGTFLIGQYYGGKDDVNRLKACKTVIIFNSIFSLALGIIMASFSPLIIKGLNIDDSIYDLALRYFLIQTIILPLNGIIFSTHAICKGHGKSVLPFVYSGLGVSFNILYDFIFIYLLDLKSDGAAIASVLAYLSAAICIMSYLIIFKFKFKNPLKGVKTHWSMYKHLAKQVLPLSIQEALTIVSFMTLVIMINKRGIADSNVIAISDRISTIGYAPIMALGNSISAAIAQNLGNGDIKRSNKIVWTGVGILIASVIIFSLPLFIFSKDLAKLYTDDAYIIEQVQQRCWVIYADIILCILVYPMAGLASGSGNSKWSLAMFLIGNATLRIPLTIIFSLLNWPIWVVSIAYPLSTLLGVILALTFYFRKKWQNLANLPIFQTKNANK